jgi:hypothetical protein
MLKKTLLAVAVSSIVAAPAMAMTKEVTTSAGGAFTANTLAIQTKQEVLDKTSLDAKLSVTFDNTVADANDELKAGGEIILTLTGDGQFNPEKIADLMNISGDETTVSFPGLDLNISNGTLDADFTTVEQIKKLFKVDTVGTGAAADHTIRYELDSNNQRLSLRVSDDLTPVFDVDGAGGADTAAKDALVNVTLDFDSDPMAQGFKLISGSKSQVAMTIGALQNASFTANPQTTVPLFKTEDLFELKQDTLAGNADATALVADTYTQWDQGASASLRNVKLWNNSTLQNIQTGELKLTLSGDFSGIAKDGNFLADSSGDATDWAVSEGKATVTYSSLTTDVTIPGTLNNPAYAGYDLVLPDFNIAEDNDESIEAQSFKLKAEIVPGSFTYVPFEDDIGDAFIVVRDGMKFDTVTTGTSSSNVIYIRDVSKTLPEEGGKIFVTITEYDAHAADANGEGTDLVTRAVLPVRLPSNGAVTLTPKGIADMLGVETTDAHQARFFFEIETNQGEAAVKKQTSDGVDIQTGRSQNVTNFTL